MNLNFVTAEKYYKDCKKDGIESESLRELIRREGLDGKCENCEQHVWRLVDNGLCFSCTTGESDGSDDYEIGEPYFP